MVNDTKTMIEEYRTNYKNGLPTAIQAHDFMNTYKEDDSGKLFGDFMLDVTDEDLVEALLQANGQSVLMLQEQLAYACDTGKNTWLDRMEQLGSYSNLRKQVLKAYNNDANKADKALKQKYNDKAQIIDGENLGTEYTYSVKDYADYLLAHAAEREDWTKAVPLVKAMLNYGAYSQINFDKNPTDLANANLTEDEKTLGDVSIDIADPITDNLPEGTTFEGATLSLKSETTLSLYFKSNTDLEFSCNGYTVEKATSGDYQIARIRGIKAKNIGDVFSLNVNGTTVTYSPLNYCKNVLTPSSATADEAQPQDEKLVNVVKALYLYWQAANSYFD